MRHAGLVIATSARAEDRITRTTTTTTEEVRGGPGVTTKVVRTSSVSGSKMVDLASRAASGSAALQEQLARGEPQSGKLGQRILTNLLSGGQENREGRGTAFRDLIWPRASS